MSGGMWVLPELADPAAPTAAELAAGTEIPDALLVDGPFFTATGFGPSYSVSAPVLTSEVVTAAMELVLAHPQFTICAGSDVHCVSPSEMARGGLARCASCFAVIDLGPLPFAPSKGRWAGRWEP